MKCPHCHENASFYTDKLGWGTRDVIIVSCSRCDKAIGCTVDIDDKVNKITIILEEISKGIDRMVQTIERIQ